MLKRNLTLVILLCLLGLFGCYNVSEPEATGVIEDLEEYKKEFVISSDVETISNKQFNQGCVADKDTAARIAKAVFEPIYGEGFDNGLPLLSYYDEERQAWLIKTQLPKVEDGFVVGGDKYIIISKNNAEILAIWGEL